MTSPIQNHIGMIFIPVSDMPRAIAWYSQLFGIPIGPTSHEDKIYTLPMVGQTGLILDSHKPVSNSSQPLCFFWTNDLHLTYTFLQSLSIEIVSPIEDIGSVSTLLFRDPDLNLLMVCQTNQR